MKPSILLLSVFIFVGCASRPSIEQLAKKYMSDSVVPKMDDPASYQFVSIDKPDSISNHAVVLKEQMEYLTALQTENTRLETNNLQRVGERMDSTGTKLDREISQGRNRIDSIINNVIASLNEKAEKCRKELLKPDSVNHLIVTVNYRGKNKMGALVLDKIPLRYYPSDNKFFPSQE